MRCRPATREDIPEITRIVTEGFLDYPLHIMLKPYLYHPEQYPQCLTALNRMLACAYQRSRNAFVVETGGRIVATALMHDRKVGFASNITSGGYELFRYATPRLIADFANVTNRADQIAMTTGTSTGTSRFSRWTRRCVGVESDGGLSPRFSPTLLRGTGATPTAS